MIRGPTVLGLVLTLLAGVPTLSALVSPEPTSWTATGKERLSDKASDEQRVDNCNVPADRRGSKPRPDCGETGVQGAPTPDASRKAR